jgi:hypothetical protein
MARGGRSDLSESEEQAFQQRFGALQIIPPEEIADVVVEFVRDESLSGRAMMVRNGRPRALFKQSDMPRIF